MLNLQATMLFAAPYIGFQPMTIGGLEPALTAANIVKQTILGAPFTWAWNRGSATIACVQGTQDYVKALSDFGFIEKAWATSADGNSIYEMQVKQPLSKSKETGRPDFISAQLNDGAGNITFRTLVAPQEAYNIEVLYQKKAVLMTSPASLWYPIPDELSHIFNWGFLALATLLVEDGRSERFMQRFIAHLLGAQDGLDAMQKQIFLGNWLEITKSLQRATQSAAQGTQARQI
jgi:hypothetical protein